MNDVEWEQHRQITDAVLTRRRLLAAGTGMGAAGLIAGLAGAAPAGAAPASATTPGGTSGPGPFGTDAVPSPGPVLAASPAATYGGAVRRTIAAEAFIPGAVAAGASLVGIVSPVNGAYNSQGGGLFAALDMPAGSILKQVDCYGYASGAAVTGTPTWMLISYGSEGDSTIISSTAAPAGPGVTQKTFTGLNAVASGDSQIFVDLTVSQPGYVIVGVTYQYLSSVPAFHFVEPSRVYDSRVNSPTGAMTAGTFRLVSVAHAFRPNTNTVLHYDIVPVGAQGISCNLTVLGTTGTGSMQTAPYTAVVPTVPSISWTAPGQTLSNGLVSQLISSRSQRLFCVGGGAHVVLDVLGYYL